MGPQPGHEIPDDLDRGARLGRGAIAEQLTGQAAARRPPDGGALDRRRAVALGPARLLVLGTLGHRGPEEPGDEHGVVDQRTGVAGAQLEGGDVGGGPDVEVRHFGVADHAGPHQVGDHALVLRHRLQAVEAARGGPALPDHGAHAGVTGVAAPPERGAGRQRQQDGQSLPQTVGHPDRQVAVADPDVHLVPADQLLVDQQPVLLVHPAETPPHGELEVLVGGLRGHADGRHGQPEVGGDRPELRPEVDDLVVQLLQGRRRGRVHLHRAALELGAEALAGQPPEKARRVRRQRPRRRIEELQLLLGPQRAGDRHDPGPYDPNVSGRWPFSGTGVAAPRCPGATKPDGGATGPPGYTGPTGSGPGFATRTATK